MNMLVFTSIINRQLLQNYLASYIDSVNIDEEFVDFSKYVWWFDIQNYFELFILMVASFSFLKVLIEIRPDQFEAVVHTIILFLANWETLMFLVLQVYMYLGITYFMFSNMGDYMFGVNRFLYSFVRVLIFILNGLFWERRTHFGIEESMGSVMAQTSHSIVYFSIFVTRLISQYIVFNIYVSKILVVLEKTRKELTE